ncbi:MAG: hypothetical protein ACQES9_02775 [Myxococcota bacterium]
MKTCSFLHQIVCFSILIVFTNNWSCDNNSEKKKESKYQKELAQPGILTKNNQKLVMKLNKYTPANFKIAKKLLVGTNPVVSRLVLKKISSWPLLNSKELFIKTVRTGNSFSIRENALDLIWDLRDGSKSLDESLESLLLELLSDPSEPVYLNAYAKFKTILSRKHHQKLREIIGKSDDKRLPSLFKLLCTNNISRRDSVLIIKKIDSLKEAKAQCLKKVEYGKNKLYRY